MRKNSPRRSGNWTLISAQAIIRIGRVIIRLNELFGDPRKRAKYRAFREKMEDIEQQKKLAIQKLNAVPPGDPLEALDDLYEYLPFEARQQHEDLKSRVHLIREEGEKLRAMRAEVGDDFAEAARRYREYLDNHPNSQNGYACLANALLKIKDWDGSIAAFREAERRASNDIIAGTTRIQIGKVLHEKGDYTAAIAQFEQILRERFLANDVLHHLVYLALGDSLAAAGRTTQARAAWKRAAKLNRLPSVAQEARERLKAS